MHYFGLMQYPKEMQFMDAPRNQPCCGPARSTVRRCWPPLLHGSLLSGAHCSHTNGPFARCCRPFGVHARLPATYTAWLFPCSVPRTSLGSPGRSLCMIFIVCKSHFHGWLWTATFRKLLMKPQVTHWILPVYVFHRNELTNRGAEIFLTFHSTAISKEIIVSHHTRAIISRGLYFFLPNFHFDCGLYCRQFMY